MIAHPVVRTAAGAGAALCLLSAAAYSAVPILGKLGFDEGLSVSTLLVGRFGIASVVLWLLALRFDAMPGVVTGLLLGLVFYAGQNGFYFAAAADLRHARDPAGLHRPRPGRDHRGLPRAGAALPRPGRGDPPLPGRHRARADRGQRPGRDRPDRHRARPRLRGRLLGLHADHHAVVANVAPLTLSAAIITGGLIPFLVVAVVSADRPLPTSGDGWGIVLGMALLGTVLPVAALTAGTALSGRPPRRS